MGKFKVLEKAYDRVSMFDNTADR